MFGADLSEELAKSHTEAPLVVVKCVEEIEKACSHHGMFNYPTHLVLAEIINRQTVSIFSNRYKKKKKTEKKKLDFKYKMEF